MTRRSLLVLVTISLALAVVAFPTHAYNGNESRTLLNVSFDPTRELYDAINPAFVDHWKKKTGETIQIKQSHGGSGKQARSVIDGLEADVVTLALASDIDQIAEKGKLLATEWQTRLPNRSTPYSSTIVFLVRKGNPKNIKDWPDVGRSGVSVVTPNPKTSGGARWNYLAAWGYSLKVNGNDQEIARALVAAIFKNVAVLDTGARGSTNTFVQRGLGDVLIGWESDAILVQKEFADQHFEVVYPSVSIKAEPPVALVDKVADKHGNRDVAEEYLRYLYSDSAQETIAKHYFRPAITYVAAKHHEQFRSIPLFTVDELFNGWESAQKTHFDEGGVFDILQEHRK